MSPTRIAIATIVCLFSASQTWSQERFSDHRTRLLLDAEVGSETALGYELPSSAFGPSMEIPVGNRLEFQTRALYSPDRKAITGDGQSLMVSGSAIAFATQRLGLIASLEHVSLWTSQFDKSSWLPSAGVVVRNDYFGAGRLYLTYVFPTGCVWATVANPCKLQSNRLQGFEFSQDIRSPSHIRWGFTGGLYHFCDQANPNAPQAGRRCHWAPTALVTLRFEFHLGRWLTSAHSGSDGSDNF